MIYKILLYNRILCCYTIREYKYLNIVLEDMSVSEDEAGMLLPFGSRARVYLALAMRRGQWLTIDEVINLTGLKKETVTSTVSRLRVLPLFERTREEKTVSGTRIQVEKIRLAPLR